MLTFSSAGPSIDEPPQFSAAIAALVSSGETERVWRALVSALPAAIYITDASGRIIFYNDAAAALWGGGVCYGLSGSLEAII